MMPPKGSRKSAAAAPNRTLVLDNGAYTIKAGIVSSATAEPSYDDCRVIPNCIARSTRDKCTYVASELDDCKDFGELAFRRPVEKGFIVNWEAEKAVWEHEFMGGVVGEGLRCDPKETNLLLTEKPNCPKELQKNCDEIVFEQFEFASYYRCVGPRLNAYHSADTTTLSALPQECLLIIDTSFSDTTILPLYNGKLLQSAVRRLTVGGKLLTNYLKELASLRHYNLMEETYLMNEIKEAISYVAPSAQYFAKDLERTWKGRLGNKRELDSSVVVDYVLPDYETAIHGHARPHDPVRSSMRRGLQPLQGPREDLLPMGNERFAVPELLFNPSDIGIQEEGIPGAVMESMRGLPEALRVGMLANVVVVGGNSLITGFIERLEAELRALVPAQYLLNISKAEDPIKHTWLGAASYHLHVSTPMRRIPRPSRAIDPPSSLHTSSRHRITPSPCRAAVAPCTHTRTSTAAFSTTSANAFLLPGKQDKKKHQQFVRKWQKRLLGDSEPIGAHVDPYDPTSPVRIAPEEQGEYEEVLDEEVERHSRTAYVPAEKTNASRPGLKLMRVGGEAWLDQKREVELAQEFEKLTCRTYTPLTLGLAEEIESLTGSPYTTRAGSSLTPEELDDVHAATGRPYTDYDFGLHRKIAARKDLPGRFVQAVAEVYTLKQAGLDPDLAKLPNRGVYSSQQIPPWVNDIKLRTNDVGELALTYPVDMSAEEILEQMQRTPEWEAAQTLEEAELYVAEGEALLAEAEAADHLDPVLPQETQPTMDPATPSFKRAAVVKIDPEKKPFDFMSNRPVPREKPVEPVKVEAVPETTQPTGPSPSRIAELVTAFETSQAAVSDIRHSVLEHRSQRLAQDIAALRKAIRQSTPSTYGAAEVKWRQVPITDLSVKFAIFKRVFQLTGLRLSDSQLTASKTLGDLYRHLCDAAKPKPKSLHSAIYLEGHKARERAKQREGVTGTSKSRADLGDLITLGNVQIRRVEPDKAEKRTKTGVQKVINYALWERGLTNGTARKPKQPSSGKGPRVLEGTWQIPEFGQPVSSKTMAMLAKKRRSLEQ
ncbi:actin-domain-containing protein [Paraphoma chrysanthemicola]|nr:actin-domain-containing protein [Paraphoma chrysanthemicola]